MKYYLPKTTLVISNESSTTLRTGTLHQDEVSISHRTSTPQFLEKLKKLLETGQLLSDDGDGDFDTLVSLNVLGKTEAGETKSRHLILVSKTLPERVRSLLETATQEVMVFEEAFGDSYVEKVLRDRGPASDTYDNSLLKNLCREYQHFHAVAPLSELLRIRAFNRSMKFYGTPFTLSLIDNHNTYFTSVKHGYTGCFECLERHIVSRFAGTTDEYAEQARPVTHEEAELLGEDLYLAGILLREIANIDQSPVTALYGNVAYFNFTNYEYSFDVNRVQGSCPTCATLNNIKFKEQYIRSCNIVERIIKEGELQDAHAH